MNTETADAILGHHNGLRSWQQLFMFATREGLVDLSPAIGEQQPLQLSLNINPTVIPIGLNAALSTGLILNLIVVLSIKLN